MSAFRRIAPAQSLEKDLPAQPNAGAPHPCPNDITRGGGSAADATEEIRQATAGRSAAEYTFLAAPRAAGELGRLGGYRVIAVLRVGGMGVVFEAEDPLLRRRVALKAMKPWVAASADARRRFVREAQTAASVEHENIVTILQVGDERGIPFIAMPLLRGETLAERLENAVSGHEVQSPKSKVQSLKSEKRMTPLPVAEILRIGREISAGLAAAHEQGLIHGDVKPANIWLEAKTGLVKLFDFGLARAVDEERPLTPPGGVLGTPSYMSPEQTRGEAVDHRADLFSVGSVLYHMATGRRPFRGSNTFGTLLAVATIEPAAPKKVNPRLPARLDRLIRDLMAKRPGDRPENAQQVMDRLLAIGHWRGWAAGALRR